MKNKYSSAQNDVPSWHSVSGRSSTRRSFGNSISLKFLSLLVMPLVLLAFDVSAQSSTINTLTMGSGYNGSNNSGSNSFITFAVSNNSGSDLKITEIGNWCQTLHNNTQSTLYYSSTSLGGSVNLTSAAWTQVVTQTVTGVTGSGVHPVLSNISFVVPDGATYRLAIATNASQNNYTLGTGTPNNFTVAGMTLYAGNHQFGGQNVGYASSNNPRFFTGYITFEPAVYGANNAGVSDVTSPTPRFCAGNFPVKVSIKNNGINTINSVNIDWELDGNPQTGTSYNTAIPSGGSAEVTLSNSETFTTTPRTVKAWTSMPNGVVDTVTGNDTIEVVVRTGLSGTYVVGPNGDFPDVVTAAAALTQYGVCGPVVMNIENGTYTGQVGLGNIGGVSATNRITFQSQSGNAGNVVIAAAPPGSGYVFQFNDASYITLKNVTVTSTAPGDGFVVNLVGNSSHDSVLNCIINSTGTTSGSDAAGIYAVDITGDNNAIIGNTINSGYYGIRYEGVSTSNLTEDNVIDNNIINNAYRYSVYMYYTRNTKFRNNKISALGVGTHDGLRTRYCDGNFEVIGNEIVITGTSGTKYGMYNYYNDGSASEPGLYVNNTVAIENGSSTAHGIYSYYSRYQNFINNSFSINTTSTSSWAGRFYYSSTSYRYNKVFNNVFSNVTGANHTLYIYRVNYNNEWDYNNIHSGNGKLVQRGSPSGTFNTLEQWQNAEDQDLHSISYDPGFVSTTDLHPDPNNPASWSLNGRALHINGNNADKANNTRVELRANGVPDIGAYEFEPDVAPPAATATPSSADPGDTQVFTFGQREVARIKWGVKAPIAAVEVRQYSGEKGVGIAAAAAPSGSMYFHTDVKTLGNIDASDIELNVDYMDIWLGDISNENDLRMAHKVGSFNWSVYNGTLSTSNPATNNLDAKRIHQFGSFTGLEDGAIPSAFVSPQGRVVFCIGDTVLLDAEPKNGAYYKWYFNGNAISGAEGATYDTYVARQAGSYSVAVTQNGKVVESTPLPISTIAAPNAVITANKQLTYCIGNGLTLNAGTTSGVTYQWQLDGQNISGANSNTYPVAQAGNYSVLVENIGCASVSAPTPVSAGPLDVFIGNDTTFCEKPGVFAELDAGYPGATYTWSTGATTKTIQARQTGAYWVRVDGGPNCVDVDTIQVNIDPLPKANGISFVQNGNTYEFYASGVVGATGYMWIFSDGTTSTDQNPKRTIAGDLYVRLVMFNACGTDTVQLGWPLKVQDVQSADDVVLYPNPANTTVNLKLNGDMKVEQLTIINGVGAVVKQVSNVAGNKQSIDVANLPAGHYTLRVITADGIIAKPFNIIR